MKTLRISFLIQIISFQLLFGQVLADTEVVAASQVVPASQTLLADLIAFKFDLVGGEKQADCEEEAVSAVVDDNEAEVSTLWAPYLQSISKVTNGTQENEEVAAPCKPERVSGHLDTITEKIIKAEEENKGELRVVTVTLKDMKASEFQVRASRLFTQTKEFISNTNNNVNERRSVLLQFLENVSLPMRDYYIAIESYLETKLESTTIFYEHLLPAVPADLLEGPDATTFESSLIEGLTPSVSPFFLKVTKPLLFGDSTLEYDHAKILQRDSIAILKAPTTLNYVRSLKWMSIQMMTQQMQIYDAMNGDVKDIEVPVSCQTPSNGNLKGNIESSYTAESGNEILDNILLNHKLTISEEDTQFLDYYLYNVDRNPMKEGYSGLMPFENYRAAKQGLEEVEATYMTPDIDDMTHYQAIVDLRLSGALAKFSSQRSYVFGLIDFEDRHYSGRELFESIFSLPAMGTAYSYKDQNNADAVIETSGTNLSLYMVELMQRHKVSDWFELISDNLEDYLKSNEIRIKFPSMFSSAFRKQWALTELERWFIANKDTPDDHYNLSGLTKICGSGRTRGVEFCQKLDKKEMFAAIISYLQSTKNADEFIPTRALSNDKHIMSYKVLSLMWEHLAEMHPLTKSFPTAYTNEYDYLLDQFDFYNPWARTRLSYLLALDELGAIKEGVLPSYSQITESERNSAQTYFLKASGSVKKLIRRVSRAAHAMGVNTVLHPAYGNYILSKNEKRHIWKESLKNGSELFGEQDEKGDYLYQKLDAVAAKTFLSQDDVNNFVKNDLANDSLDDNSQEKISLITSSEFGQKGEFLRSIYNAKGDVEKQVKLYTDFGKEFGFDSQFSAKQNFLVLDNVLKTEVYKSLIRKGAKERREKLTSALDSLCSLRADDFDSLKAVYFATVKQQSALNALRGGSPVPADVLKKIEDKLNGVSLEEKSELKIGLMLMGASIGAMLLAGSCVATLGATCVAAMGLAGSAMTLQVGLARKQYRRKVNSDEYVLHMEELQELGFTDSDSVKEIQRSWFWTGFEAVSVIPLMGLVGRSVKLGSKVTLASVASATRSSGARLAGIKEASATAVQEIETNFARIVLELDGTLKQTGNFVRSLDALATQTMRGAVRVTTDNVDKARELSLLHQRGLISSTTYVNAIEKLIVRSANAVGDTVVVPFKYASNVIVKESVEQINAQTAKVVSAYLGHNPRAMEYLLGSYVKKLPKARNAMEIVNNTKLNGIRTALPWARNGIRKLRFAHLDEYSEAINRLHSDIGRVVSQGGDFEKYILDNVDELTDIFMKIPMRKRELPYMALVQGGFHVGRGSVSATSPLIQRLAHTMANGLVLRKIFNARSTLVYQSKKSAARTQLGLTGYVSTHSTFEVFQGFQAGVSHLLKSSDNGTADQVLAQYNDLQESIVGVITKETNFKDGAEVRRLLFNGETIDDMAQARALWNSVHAEKLLGIDEISGLAHRIVQEGFETSNEFERYLSALRIEVLKRDSGNIEIM
jgi:hypothetical protein